MSGPEGGHARYNDEREWDQRQIDPCVSRPESRIGRQQCIEHVRSEELAHSEGAIRHANQVDAYRSLSVSHARKRG